MLTPSLAPALTVGTLLLAGLGLAACGDDDDGVTTSGGGTSPASSADAKTIALLQPSPQTAPAAPRVRAALAAELDRLCPDCDLLSAQAGDAAKQQSQAEAVIIRDANVLVVDPVDPATAKSIVTKATDSEIPVVSYDRLIEDADVASYVSYDPETVGVLQGRGLVAALGRSRDKNVVALTGPADDPAAAQVTSSALDVIETANVNVVERAAVADGTAAGAEKQMKRAIEAVGANRIDGVYAADDEIASGAITALQDANVDPADVPVTGQGADLAAIQRIVAGDQEMTVFRAVTPEAQAAARLAFALSQGTTAPSGLINAQTDNGAGPVPSVLLQPVTVTRDTIASTVVAEGAFTVEQICTQRYASACRASGVTGSP